MSKMLNLLFFLFVFVGTANAETLYAPQKVSGDFVQKKQIKEVDITLTSKGKFAIDKVQGIKWQTNKPYPSTMIISGGKLCMKNGAETEIIDSENNQILAHVIQVMQSLLTQDYAVLQKYFDYTIDSEDGAFKVTLETTDKTIASVFTKMKAKGKKFIEEVEMYNDKGDVTTLTFSNMIEKTGEISCD